MLINPIMMLREKESKTIHSKVRIRIKKITIQQLSDHDRLFVNHDKSKWQTDYSLTEHCLTLARVVKSVSKERGKSKSDVYLAELAAMLHDVGKIEYICHLYRLNRFLDPEELISVHKHPRFSSLYVRSLRGSVRKEDYPILKDISLIVKNHHAPWRILRRNLRTVAWDIMVGDIFIAMQEKRHRVGLTQFEAVKVLAEAVSQTLRKKAPKLVPSLFDQEIRSSVSIISSLYGAESIIASR